MDHQNNPRYLKMNDKSPVKHKFTAMEYTEKMNECQLILDKIHQTLKPSMKRPVKKQILKISLQNIQDSFDYYYNDQTYRIQNALDTRFINSTKNIEESIVFLPQSNSKEDVQDIVRSCLKTIKQNFIQQHRYIRELEQEYHKNKVNPNNISSNYFKN